MAGLVAGLSRGPEEARAGGRQRSYAPKLKSGEEGSKPHQLLLLLCGEGGHKHVVSRILFA